LRRALFKGPWTISPNDLRSWAKVAQHAPADVHRNLSPLIKLLCFTVLCPLFRDLRKSDSRKIVERRGLRSWQNNAGQMRSLLFLIIRDRLKRQSSERRTTTAKTISFVIRERTSPARAIKYPAADALTGENNSGPLHRHQKQGCAQKDKGKTLPLILGRRRMLRDAMGFKFKRKKAS